MANVNGLLAKGVPPQPLWLLYIKGGILFLSLIIFCLSCFTLSRWGGGPGGLTLWAVCFPAIHSPYHRFQTPNIVFPRPS